MEHVNEKHCSQTSTQRTLWSSSHPPLPPPLAVRGGNSGCGQAGSPDSAATPAVLRGDSGGERTGHWPWRAKVPVKGMISMSPDLFAFPYKEKG